MPAIADTMSKMVLYLMVRSILDFRRRTDILHRYRQSQTGYFSRRRADGDDSVRPIPSSISGSETPPLPQSGTSSRAPTYSKTADKKCEPSRKGRVNRLKIYRESDNVDRYLHGNVHEQINGMLRK